MKIPDWQSITWLELRSLAQRCRKFLFNVSTCTALADSPQQAISVVKTVVCDKKLRRERLAEAHQRRCKVSAEVRGARLGG